ncbi:MAG: FtsW/RodA/SpoVE family cell cycle protein [Sphaerochaetaceae bacterium]|nr:FtsW/RodA/SpoVE family cell cycle protein [Sphaerochaetaceae bacterium]HHU89372.1 FtsW/RodA/SpoVE family cell cycle protein [Spirochaetales bacterium]
MNYNNYDDLFVESRPKPPSKALSKEAFLFTAIVLALLFYGLIVLYSASYDEAFQNGLKGSYYFTRQLLFALLGLIVYTIIRWIPISLIRRLTPLLLLASFGLMLLTLFTPWGVTRYGARRWIQIGSLPSFQPSELLKVSANLFVALLLSKWDGKSLFTPIISVVTLLFSSLLIIIQKDYSTTLIFLLGALALLVVAGFKVRYLLLLMVPLTVAATLFLLIEPYRIKRVVSFLFPNIDPSGLNWQVQKALEAIKSGGVFGRGLGNGVYKLGIIPEVQNDFIFASLAEELGVVGVLLLALLLLAFTYYGFRVALHFYRREGEERFMGYAAFGITFMIIWQAIVNLAVVTSLLPPTGIPLPFFSQGGTNLLMILVECGLLYKFILYREKEGTDYE